MREIRTPTTLALALALLASLAVHLPAYVSLGALAKWQAAQFRPSDPPVFAELEIEIEVGDEDEASEPEPSQETTEPEAVEADTEDPPPQRRRRRRPPPAEPDEEEQEQEELEAEIVEVRPMRPEPMNRQAVQQRSRDPNVETPEDARFLAEENQRVDEETQARIRSYTQDEEEISAGETSESAEQELGNDDLQEVADARDMEGSDRRDATEEEANAERPEEAEEIEPPNVVARGDTARTGSGREEGSDASSEGEGGDDGGSAPTGGGETRVVEIHDGHGTILVRVPVEGQGQGDVGGRRVAGVGEGQAGEGAAAGRQGRGRAGDRGRGRGSNRRGPDLRVSWSEFEETFTPEQLEQEREAFIAERRSRMRGSNRQENWNRFRAAIENFVPNVRPGNQTALNAAASPFANYIAAVHRRIHRQFADRFLRGLPAGGTSPFADRTLMAKLEIIMNRDGSVHRIGVVRQSGFLPFDHGAFSAVMRGQPYPEAPGSILSGDGRVYFHWAFYRNERQCGTFNAEPYILPNPPGTPRPGAGPFRDELHRGGVVPDEARPTWGSDPDGEEGGDSEPAEDPPQQEPRPVEEQDDDRAVPPGGGSGNAIGQGPQPAPSRLRTRPG